MLKYVLLAAIVATALAMPVASDDWESFKARYGKNYANGDEELRKSIFNANLAKIESLKLQDTSATYGVTEFADLTEDEFRTQRMGLQGGFACKPPAGNNTYEVDANADSADWRAKGAVTPVKNQGQCGSCWAFSTTGSIEGATFIKTGKLPSLSEQDLVDCDKVDQGCNGGLMDQAMSEIMKAGGLESESDYPYKGIGGTCQFSKSKVAATISSYNCLDKDEAKIAAYVAANGPVSIALNAGPMQFYMGGVADPLMCSPSHLDHGVLIVGFGTEGSKPYWIIKNSWGEGWGEKGYYRLYRGKNKCGVSEFAVGPVV